jgi:hypothetical protein
MDVKYEKNNNKFFNEQFKKIETEINLGGQKAYDINNQEKFEVEILPDKSVEPALFKPLKVKPNSYKAHPDTIKAMKKNIFVTSGNYIDHEILYTCQSCKKSLDLQFWNFCPYCCAQFKL